MHRLHNTVKFQTNIYAGGAIMERELCNAYRVWCVYIILPLPYCGQSVQLLVKTMSVEQHMHSNCMCHMFVHAIMMSYTPTHHG